MRYSGAQAVEGKKQHYKGNIETYTMKRIEIVRDSQILYKPSLVA